MKVVIDASKLDEAKVMSTEACMKALEICGQRWENHARDYAPVDTGRLKNSIEHHPEGDDTMVIQTNVEYAIYQELGTSRQSGTPFLRPAGENHISEYKNIIETELKK